ncbi:MAG: hypothetical protein M1833_006904 [Piccolia ochrophora]|nr:MAG: hypothetical protein M1833_006904 [Piccolia ochrophora]
MPLKCSPSLTPIVLPLQFPVDIIDYILQRNSSVTKLVICSSRDDFLNQLLLSIQHSQRDSSPSGSPRLSPSTDPPQTHPLLIPTIRLLAACRSAHLAFCPTLQHLRAYLATYTPPQLLDTSDASSRDQAQSMLFLLSPIELHRPTPDFSAQGLSRTLAAAVETADRVAARLVIAEAVEFDEEGSVIGGGVEVWNEQVQLLNGIGRGLGGEENWTGRTISVGQVAARWCVFEHDGSDGYVEANER